jgi:putative flippase GtrA
VKVLINAVLDAIYPLFRGLMPRQTYRYAACGGGNTLLDIIIYYISFNYIFQGKMVPTPVVTISAPIAAMLCGLSISFPLGFYLSRTIVFPGSTLRGRVQLFRYFIMVSICLVLNYIFIKLFVEQFHIYPPLSKVLTTVIVVTFSYLTQKNFTFKIESSGVVTSANSTLTNDKHQAQEVSSHKEEAPVRPER